MSKLSEPEFSWVKIFAPIRTTHKNLKIDGWNGRFACFFKRMVELSEPKILLYEFKYFKLFVFNLHFFICGKTEKNAGVGMLAYFEISQVPTAGRWQMTFAPHGSLLKPCIFFRFSANYFLFILLILYLRFYKCKSDRCVHESREMWASLLSI